MNGTYYTYVVHKNGYHIGSVDERSEILARAAALSRYGMSEEEIEEEGLRHAPWNKIGPGDEFDVRCIT